jgi:hypothetical protein
MPPSSSQRGQSQTSREEGDGMTYIYRRTEDIDREPTAPYVLREPEVPQMFKKVFKPELCGSTSGYQQHRRFKEQHCPDCREAYNEYQRGYRAGERIKN